MLLTNMLHVPQAVCVAGYTSVFHTVQLRLNFYRKHLKWGTHPDILFMFRLAVPASFDPLEVLLVPYLILIIKRKGLELFRIKRGI